MIPTKQQRHLGVIAALLCFFCVQAAWSSVTGRVSGTVNDPTGAVVPGATVTAVNTETGIKQTTHSDQQGFYSFPSLPVGHYELTVRASGFKDYKQTGLILDVNTALLVDVPLQIGEASQEVTVNVAREDGSTFSFQTIARLDSPIDVTYYENGGILLAVLRRLMKD